MDQTPDATSSVDVELAGGPFTGSVVQAPRDDAGRVLAGLWVRRSSTGSSLLVTASTGEGGESAYTRYRFESWTGKNPVYRFDQSYGWGGQIPVDGGLSSRKAGN